MKKTVFLLVLILMVSSLHAVVMDRILVKVNDEVVLQSEVDEAVSLLSTQLKMAGKPVENSELKKKIIDNLVEQKLVITMAEKEQVGVSAEAVADKVNDFVDSLRKKFPDEESFEDALEKEGLSYTDFRLKIEDQVKNNLVYTKVKQKKQQEFISKAGVGIKELSKYYDDNKSDFKVDDEVKIAQIFIVAGKQKKEFAQKIKNRIDAGENFDSVVDSAKNSDGVSGGELGWVDTTQMDKKIRTALKRPKKEKVVGPIETQQGFHIIKILDYKKGKYQTLDEVKGKVRVKIIEDKIDDLWAGWIKEIKKSAYINYMK